MVQFHFGENVNTTAWQDLLLINIALSNNFT